MVYVKLLVTNMQGKWVPEIFVVFRGQKEKGEEEKVELRLDYLTYSTYPK